MLDAWLEVGLLNNIPAGALYMSFAFDWNYSEISDKIENIGQCQY